MWYQIIWYLIIAGAGRRCPREGTSGGKLEKATQSPYPAAEDRHRHAAARNIAAISRAWLSLCHAERGAFTEGLAMAEEGLRIAETGNHPFSLIVRVQWGRCGVSAPGGHAPGHPYARAGHGAVPGLAHSALLAQADRRPGPGVCPGGACRRGSGAGGTRGGASGRRGQTVGSGARGRLPQRGVSAGWPPGRRAPTRRAGGRSRPPVPATRHTRPGRCGSWARARRARRPPRASRPQATTARPSPWPRNWACARSRPTATAAWARCMPRQASGSRPVPRCPPLSTLYRAMDMTFWLPQAEAALAQVG